MYYNNEKISHICSIDECQCFLFKASLFNYFYVTVALYEHLFTRSIRETIDYIYSRGKGYCPIYQIVDGCVTGYATVVRGGGRFTFSTPNDIIVCNVWIDPNFRNKGLAKKLINAIIYHCGFVF